MRITLGTTFVALLLVVAATTLEAQSPPYGGYANGSYNSNGQPYGFWIERVRLVYSSSTLLDNASGYTASPYNTYYGAVTPANLVPGNQHQVIVNTATGSYSMHAAVFIDYNNDGDFLDSGELVCATNAGQAVSQPGPINMNFTPQTGFGGVRRMRVRLAYNSGSGTGPLYGAINNATTNWGYGETEDYLVNLGFAIETQSPLPTGAQGTAYNQTITAVNGDTPYAWQFAGNGYIDPAGTPPSGYSYGLPPGITASVAGNALVLSGTPTTVGAYAFDVEVLDAAPNIETSNKQYTITVVPPPAAMPFFDDFSAFTGWQLDTTWTRGTATAYSNTGPPRNEPANDHTATSDNMILGDNIGGDYATSQSATRWAISPMVNCASASTVRLRFWRWAGFALGSEAWIQVSNNGNNWFDVYHFDGTGSTVSDGTGSSAGWKSIFYDITQWAAGNATVQVRFGIGPTGSSPHTGWCIDDFQIEEPGPDLTVHETGSTGPIITDNQAVGGARDFGQVAVSSQSAPLTIFFDNTGPSTITFGTMTKTGAQPSDFYVNASAMINPLQPGQSTSFTVTFYRTTTGVSTATLNWPHNATGSGTSPFEINLRGEAIILQPDLEVRLGSATGPIIPHGDPATGTTRDFGNQDIAGGPTAPIEIFICNAGTGPMNLSTPDMGGNWWNQFVLNTGSIVSQIGAGQHTSFEAAFDPSSVGSKDAYIRIAHTDGAKPSPYQVPVLGNGITSSQAGVTVHDGGVAAPTLAHNAPAAGQRDFGSQLVTAGATPPITITIENSGGTSLTLGTPVLGGNDPGEFILSTTGFQTSVGPGTSTAFTIAFDPTSTGVKTATVTFTHNDTTVTSPFVINVRGNGVNTAPVMEVRETGQTGPLITNPAPATGILNFGTRDVNAGPANPAVIFVENVGTANLTLGNVTFQAPTTEFTIQAVGFAQTLPVGSNASFSITFDPTTPGTHTAVVEFTHNDASSGSPFILNVTGDATQNAPVIEVLEGTTIGPMVTSGAPVITGGGRDCGTIDVSAGNTFPQIIVVKNTGNQNLTLGTPALAGVNAADFILNNSNWVASLAPGNDCSFDVMFDPTLGGMKDCQVEFTQDDPSQPTPFVVRFRGTAVDPSAVQITTPDLLVGSAGKSYGPFQLQASQGNTPYTWSIYDGSLPIGMNLSAAGVIDGAPAGFGGSSQVTIRVADTTGATHERQYTLIITGDLSGGKAKAGGCAVDSSGSGSNMTLAVLGILAVAGCAIGLRRRKQ